MSTTQNNTSSLNNILSEDFFRNTEEQPLPSISDDNIMMCKQGSSMYLSSDLLSQANDDKHWALQDQDDEIIRQQDGGLFDFEQDYRVLIDQKYCDDIQQQQLSEPSNTYNQRLSQHLPDLNYDMLTSAAVSDNVFDEQQNEICQDEKQCDFILKADSQSVENEREKSLETTRSVPNYQKQLNNHQNDNESSTSYGNASCSGQTFSFGTELQNSSLQQNSDYSSSRHQSVELIDDDDQTTEEFQFDTTFSRRGRKSDDQLRKLMNIYISNGGRMTKHMLQEAAKVSGLKRLQVYKWYWDLERKRHQSQQTQQTMYPSLIFKVTKFGKDITKPISRPLFRVERNARPSTSMKFRGSAKNTSTQVSPQ